MPPMLTRRTESGTSPISGDATEQHRGAARPHNFARNRSRKTLLGTSSGVFTMYRVTLVLCVMFGLASGQSYDADVVFTVDEGQPSGFSVGTIPTEPGYTYTFSDPPAEFTIDGHSGEIHTAIEIDREQLQNDVFDLLVLARNSVTSTTKPVEVRITVTDLNDNSPAFPETEISISFTENGRVGSTVILESATDPDNAENGSIVEYSISEGNSESAFRLFVIPGPDGLPIYINLETTVSLDHEIQDFYQLTIAARDNGSPPRSGFVHLNISVLDINDNPPIFDQSDFVIYVNESTPAGTKLLEVHATDGDSGVNGEVEYFIEEETSNFNVEPVSGNISLQQKLNYVSSDPYQVTVKARDKGVPTLYGRAFLSVYVIDENDHDPQISFSYIPASESFATVSEGVATGSIVALVTVTDEDLAENGEVDLQILSGNEMDHFMLDTLPLLFPTEVQTKVFKILVVGDVDRENVAEYNLTLLAWDNGSPRRQSTGNLLIQVVDTNDHSPEFQQSEYHANLSESAPNGSFVQSLTATDADFGLNAMILYSITAGNALDWFKINQETGLVTTKALLDREVASVVELNISATDQGAQPRVSATTLTVTILDENDEAPQFASPNYTAPVPENIAARFEVTTVSATDRDEGTSGLVRYAFTDDVAHQHPGIFSIDAVSGTIFTEAVLDHEERSEYDLQVRAFDSGNPPQESVVNVRIDVVDENDNVPIFYPQTYIVTVEENGPAVSFVVRVTATDSDSGNYGNVTYTIVGGNEDGKFQVDGVTGEVMTVTALDREEKAAYTLLIGATDGGDQAADISAEVRISVGDIQDSPPSFGMSVYDFEIYENANASSFVGSVSASSQDLNAQIQYIVFSGDPLSQFGIDGDSGVIRTSKALDRETTSAYELIVYANGGTMVGSTVVRVRVVDVNDNAPQFPRSTDTTDVVENWEVGRHFYHVEATDEDSPPNGDVVYDIVQNPDDIFGINHTTGWMFLNRGLQVSAQDEYVVTIVASDLGNPSLSATLNLIISVRDVNNHAPEFAAQHFETSISETTEVNHRFFSLTATDRDQGTNGMISYSILSGNDGDSFGVFPNGQVYVKNFLDRESISNYTLRVEARDNGVPSRTASTELLVEILDENDNRPFFGNSSYTFYLTEGSSVNTVVGIILATDADLGENAELSYSFVGNQTQFALDRSTGVITNLVGFDREALEAETGQSRFVLDAVVRDGGATPFQDRTSIAVVISDINDNPPVFSRSSYQVTISELAQNGTHVLRVTASDSDSGDNSYVVYSIVSGNVESKFHIDRVSGQITLIGPLDREATSEYSLTVKAQDAGSDPQRDTAEVQVQVLDENDHEPVFTQVDAVLEVTECLAIGQPITMVSATDDDIGENGLISYSISGGDEQKVFRIDPDTGDITLSKLLDHETRSSYTLNISARDSGVPQQTSVTSILVSVRDCNDNSPVFPQHTVVQRIDEEVPLNTHVVSVSASDPDSGINGQVRYSIVSQEPEGSHFSINPENGSILTSARIDYEYLKMHNGFFKLTVRATDQTLPVESRRSANTEVVIFVNNINDNAPVFQTHNAVVISRTAPEGATVTTVTADDPDDEGNSNVTYYIVNRSVPFEINLATGEISVNEVGFEPNVHMYSVRINARDSVLTSNYTSLVLNILVLGDPNNGPTFARSMYSESVSENQERGTEVVSVSAAYPSDPNADIEYYITSVVAGGVSREGDFQMTRTGVISTGAVLDREQLGQDARYEVTVYAISGTSAYSSTRVQIAVLDENDSPPTFDLPVYTANISEEARSGSPVTRLTARDADVGSNAEISYSITRGNEAGHFAVDANSGQIRTSGGLDRETAAAYMLEVRASDGRQATVTSLDVHVQDANDNDPAFCEPAYSFRVAEDHPVGTVVDAVSAVDPDAGTNGELVYSVVAEGAPGEDVFSLDSLTGEFTLLAGLNYEQKQVYFLTVHANDRGTDPRSATAPVYFNILDVNDNAPVFDGASYRVEVAEDVAVGTGIVTVTATDADSGSNGAIVFAISSGDPTNRFTVHPNGSIATVATLDRETQYFYNLEVSATDQAPDPTQRRSSVTQVTVIVLDVNDNAPVFLTGNRGAVREDTDVGEVVMFVQAADADVEKNSYIEFSLSGAPDGVFLINPVDGNIRLLTALNREAVPEYNLTVNATDKGQPPRFATMDVVIEVLDVNDNAPVFDLDSYHSSLPEDVPVRLEFLRVGATDADEGVNAELRFSIFNGNYDSDFDIDQTAGVLSVANPLDRERRASYSLVVRAQDSGDGSHISSATVTITVQDVNDNAPAFLTAYAPRITENNQPGTPVVQVSATDDDEGANGRLTYRIDGDGYGGLFAVVPDTGAIHVAALLDHEEVDSYILKVVAQDAGSPPREGATDILITVADDNDNQPQFESPLYTATLLEEIASNSPVLRVTANDADSTADLRYRLDTAIGNKFTIHPITGEILTTSGRLDREDQASYDIIVTVADGTTWTSQTTVRVDLLDIDDNPPQFAAQSYQALIPSSTSAGTIVLGVEALDADIGDNARLTYSITSGDATKFTIDANTGVITTAQPLTSQSSAHTLGVSARDGNPSHAAATATVRVAFDASGQFPSFQSPVGGVAYTFDEDAANDTEVVTLQASSPKTGPEGTVTYHLTGGNAGDRFEVDSQSGRLTIARGLNYEDAPRFSLLLEARDGGTPPLTSLLQIEVNVNDVNDNYPVFDQVSYSGRVMEELQSGADVVQVHATDADSGLFGNVLYTLRLDGNVNNNFQVDGNSGWLRTNGVLDRETIADYTLTVQAEDQGSPAKTSVATVHVAVDDINDNPLSFTNLFSATVPENAPVDTRVIRITTTDPDSVSIVQYSIVSGADGAFAIDSVTGQIRVNGSLDREVKGQYQLAVSADDGSYRKDTTVAVTISDINDNAPAFDEPSYSVRLPEGLHAGSAALQVSALDEDVGANQDVYYTLKTMSEHFIINEDTGYITVSNPVNFIQSGGSPDPNVYHLWVLARDRGVPALYSEVLATVTIYDANEYPPIFEQTEYFSLVPFSIAVDTPVLQVVATETTDQGQNAQIRYTVIGGNGSTRFDVDHDSGWIKVKLNLQNDVGNYYDVIVQAEDLGRPSPMSAQVSVQLLVTGDNDITPSFDQTVYLASVYEDLGLGSEVTVVTASDGDAGLNGKLLYSIVSGNDAGLFAIGEETGSVTVAKFLDYEDLTSHTIQIRARDQGWQSKESSTLLTVNLLDADDNAPVFSPDQYNPEVAENSPSASYVTTVTATDADTGTNAEFTYDIIGGDGKDYFTINRDTGVIRTQGNLDYEGSLNVFQLSVEAANDDTSQFGVAHVTVQLTGVNEYHPQFVQASYQFSVSEAAPDGQVVGMVFASDADHGPDGEVQYLLVGSSNRQGFAIDSFSGEIVVSHANGQLDRETEDTIVLSVLAKNNEPITGDNVDEVQVSISLLDANDPPQFLDALYQARVSELDGIGTYVTTVTAVEYDQKNDFRQFSYAIVDGNLLNAFEINALSGSITVASALDRETVATYRLRIGAIDTGEPPQTGYTVVVVDIDDVNDNGPIFLPGNDVGYISENEAINTIVMTLNATDPDLNSNPDLFTFFLVPNADSPSFTLESTTGILRTTRTLDREVKSDYYLSVESRDGAAPEMTAVSTIHVIVRDQNDNPSTERDARIEVKAYQSVFPGGPLGVVRPIDLDTNDVFICQIVSGDLNVFSLQPGCILNSRMHSVEADYALEISGDDGQHASVNSNFDVSFQAFNNASLANSITLRLSGVVPETFLSNHYDRFSASVSAFLSSRESLLILSLNNVVGDSSKMDLILAVKRDSGYLIREDVAKLINDNKATITSQSGVTIDGVDYSPCSSNPCMNSGTCDDRMQLIHTTVVVDSPSIVFVAPSIRRVFHCACHGEFFGDLCQEQIDQCDPDPCLNAGVCTDLIGDYRCSCPAGFTGKRCGIDVDDCAARPCLNGGECEDLVNGHTCHCTEGYNGNNCQNGPCALQPCLNGGTCVEDGSSYRCECRYGESGDICEVLSVGFRQGSYMEFPALSPDLNIVSLHFTTVSPKALLMYNHDGTSAANAEFLALEVVAGKVQFSYNLGDGITVITTDKMVSDGQWHKVEARRNGKNGELIVDDCPLSLPTGNCRATGTTGSQTDLNVNNVPLSIGGTMSIDTILPRAWQVSSADFLGCMRDVSVNGAALDLSSPLAQRGTGEGCDRDTETCRTDPCGGNGDCVDEWWNHWCQCEAGLTGDNCDKAPTPFSFGGGSYVQYVVKESFQRQQLLDAAKATSRRRRRRRDTTPGSQTISLTFRTGSPAGLLLLVQSGNDFTSLQIVNRTIRYHFGSAGRAEGTVSLAENVADWKWHTLQLYREGATITLESGDETESRRFVQAPHDFAGLEVSGMSLGGTETPLIIDGKNVSAFSGCLEDFQINGAALPLDGANEMFEAAPSENTGEGCDGVDVCAPNQCPQDQICTPDGDGFVCECQEGFSGDKCTTPVTGPPPDNTLVIALVSVFSFLVIVIISGCLLLLCRYRNKARRAKAMAASNAKNAFSMDSLDNPGFSADTFDNPTMIGAPHNKTGAGMELIQQQPDIIERNAFAGMPDESFIVDTDDVVIGEEASGRNQEALEHYDLENASSIAPSDIEPAYHYRYYHDGRERKQKRQGYRYSPNPMLARIGTPPCESPVSQVSSNHHSINLNPSSLHVRGSPSNHQHSTPIENSTASAIARQSPGLQAMRQSPSLQLLKKETARSATPLRLSRANTPVRNMASPISSDHSYNQSELRSQGHHSDISSHLSGLGEKSRISPMPTGAHRPQRPPSRLKDASPSDPGRPLGLTVEEVKRLNTARPDLMTGSHASTIDNLSSVSSSKRQHHRPNLAALPSDLEPSPLLEPPESTSSDETAGSFTCSEIDSDTEKLHSRSLDPGMLLLSRLSQMDDGDEDEDETYEQFSAPFQKKEGLNSVGGSLSTLFASEDEHLDPKKTNGQFSWDQFLNWGPRFETLEGVFVDIAQLQENVPTPTQTKVYLEQTAEEFV